MTKEQTQLLEDLYYKQKFMFGRDKLFKYIQLNQPDSGISRRQIAEWLENQELHQIHRDSKGEPKNIKSTIAKAPHNILGIDLMDMQNFERNQYKYILNCVDLFSRKIYALPLKNKQEKTVADAMAKIIKKIPDIKSIRSDNGSEFKSFSFKQVLERNNIQQVFGEAGKPQSNGAIERMNGVLKRLINKSIDFDDKFNWVKELPKLVENINNTVNRITKLSPNQIEELYSKQDTKAIGDIYEGQVKNKSKKQSKQKFEVGDKVRLFQPSDKQKSKKWSKEIYEIVRVIKPKKAYSVYEYQVNGFSDRFKEEELLFIPGVQNETTQVEKYSISRLVKPVVLDNEAHYEVRWKGYGPSANTIEPRNVLLEDAPKLVNLFDKKNGITWYMTSTGRVRFREN